MRYSDEKVREAVNAVFNKFDKNKNGVLQWSQVAEYVNYSIQNMSETRKASKEEVDELMKTMDINQNGKIEKMELFQIFKKVANG